MKRKIKVLHLIRTLELGGAERVVANYAKYYDKSKFELSVCCLVDRGEIADEIEAMGVKVHCLYKKGRNIGVILNLRKLLRSEGIDVVHAHNFSPALWGRLAALFASVRVVIVHAHNVVVDKKLLYSICNRALSKFTHRIIAVSDEVRTSQIKEFGYHKNKIVTIHNGLDLEFFEKETLESPNKIRKQIGIENGHFLVGNIGSLTEQKNQTAFIEMAKLVSEKIPGARFIIIGEGALRERLHSQIRSLGVEDKIKLLGKRQDVKDLLQIMDVFVLSSLWEGLPISVLEAMAAKAPIVVTDVGGNSEAIKDRWNGILVPPGDTRALADAVVEILENKDLAYNLAQNAIESVRRNFSAESMAKKTEELYLVHYGVPAAI